MSRPEDHLHPELIRKLDKLVDELPPLTEDELDALADTIAAIRLKAAAR